MMKVCSNGSDKVVEKWPLVGGEMQTKTFLKLANQGDLKVA